MTRRGDGAVTLRASAGVSGVGEPDWGWRLVCVVWEWALKQQLMAVVACSSCASTYLANCLDLKYSLSLAWTAQRADDWRRHQNQVARSAKAHKCVTIAENVGTQRVCAARAKACMGLPGLPRAPFRAEGSKASPHSPPEHSRHKQTNKQINQQTNNQAVNGTNGRHRCTRVRTRCAHAATTTATAPEAARPCRFGFVPNEMAPQVRTAKRCLVGVFGCLCASVFRRPSRALDPGADVAGVLPDAVQMW
jgi:hypothetical protein